MIKSDPQRTTWIIEDHQRLRESLTQLIASIPSVKQVEAFVHAEAALAELRRRPAPDLVIMDISLPGMNGVEATKLIKQSSPLTEIIILTVHEDNETIFNAICAGASGYLLKTSDNDALKTGIIEVFSGGASLNPIIARRILNLFNQFQKPGYDYELTDRESQILKLMVDGHNRQSIADKLFLSPLTIASHSKKIYSKLHVHNRGDAISKALKERLI